jgi:hypothetical protein
VQSNPPFFAGSSNPVCEMNASIELFYQFRMLYSFQADAP